MIAFAFLLLGVALGMAQCTAHSDLFRAKGMIPRRMKVQWAMGRVAIVAIAALLIGSTTRVQLLPLVFTACSALTCFPMVFTYLMGTELKDKGWHPLYLGATSTYDRLLLYWQLGHDVGKDPEAHYRLYNQNRDYRDDVHDAGRAAYILEGLLTVLLVALAVFA